MLSSSSLIQQIQAFQAVLPTLPSPLLYLPSPSLPPIPPPNSPTLHSTPPFSTPSPSSSSLAFHSPFLSQPSQLTLPSASRPFPFYCFTSTSKLLPFQPDQGDDELKGRVPESLGRESGATYLIM